MSHAALRDEQAARTIVLIIVAALVGFILTRSLLIQ